MEAKVYENIGDNVGDSVRGLLLEKMRENPGTNIKDMKWLRDLKSFFDEKTKELQWNAEYIAISLGFDRTPQADLVRVSQMTRQHFVMMKRDMDKKKQMDIARQKQKHNQKHNQSKDER